MRFLDWSQQQQNEMLIELAQRLDKIGLPVEIKQDSLDDVQLDRPRCVYDWGGSNTIIMRFKHGGSFDTREFVWVLAHETGHAFDHLGHVLSPRDLGYAQKRMTEEEAAWAYADCLLLAWGIDTSDDDYRRFRDVMLTGYYRKFAAAAAAEATT